MYGTLVTVLGGNHHHTVSTARTVDGGGRGVLQNLNGGNVLRIQEVGIGTYLYTVYYVQRLSIAVDSTHTADAYLCQCIRTAVLLGNDDTRGGTLQTVCQVDGDFLHHGCGIHRVDRTGNVAALGSTVTNDHHVVQRVGVFL